MNARTFLQTPAVQKVCDAQRAEADKAKWALEFLEHDIAELGHFYLEIGEGQQCRTIERKNGRFIVSRTFQESRWRDPESKERIYDNIADALTGLVEDWE